MYGAWGHLHVFAGEPEQRIRRLLRLDPEQRVQLLRLGLETPVKMAAHGFLLHGLGDDLTDGLRRHEPYSAGG